MSKFKLLVAMMVFYGISNVACAAAPAGPVAEWTFDQGRGETVRDRSGNGNDGKIFGASWVKQAEGHALSFDGVDDYVDCGAGSSLEITGNLTVQAWIKPRDMGWAGAAVVGKSRNQYQLLYSTRGLCWWYVGSGSNSVGNKLPLNQWWHVTGTYDGDRRRIYINGRLAGSAESPAPKGNGGHFFMGAVGKNFFQGLVDNVRVYDRAVSQEEMIDFLASVVGYYKQDTAGRFLSVGQLMRPLSFSTPAPMPLLNYQKDTMFPALMSGVFRAEGGLGIFRRDWHLSAVV